MKTKYLPAGRHGEIRNTCLPVGTAKYGFTLVEIIVATLLAAIIAAGMLSVFVTAKKWTGLSAQETMAVNFAQGEMERLRSEYAYGDGELMPGAEIAWSNWTDRTLFLPAGEFKDVWNGTLKYRVRNSTDPAAQPDQYKIIQVKMGWTEPQD